MSIKYLYYLLFKTYPLTKMQKMREQNSSIGTVFAFIEKGQPGGDLRESFTYWSEDGSCISSTTPLKDVLKILEKFNFWKMKNSVGTALDGIHFTVAYLDQKQSKCTRIWNPEPSSNKAQFITELRSLLMKNGNKGIGSLSF